MHSAKLRPKFSAMNNTIHNSIFSVNKILAERSKSPINLRLILYNFTSQLEAVLFESSIKFVFLNLSYKSNISIFCTDFISTLQTALNEANKGMKNIIYDFWKTYMKARWLDFTVINSWISKCELSSKILSRKSCTALLTESVTNYKKKVISSMESLKYISAK